MTNDAPYNTLNKEFKATLHFVNEEAVKRFQAAMDQVAVEALDDR